MYDIFDLKGYEFVVNGIFCLIKVYLFRDLFRVILYNIIYSVVRCEVLYFGLLNINRKIFKESFRKEV